MGLNWAEHSVEIAAPIETCFAAIIDYETFPRWQGAVVDTEVLDWDKKGRGKRVRLFIDAKVRKVDYTLDYRYDEPELIEWDFVEGNGINAADGYYLFEDLGNGRTRATYRLGLEVGIPLPGPVARRAHKSTLKGSVDDLKREAEQRAASSPKAAEEPTREREATLAERAGIKRPSASSTASTSAEDWALDDGGHSVTELPALIVGRAASTGRRVAGGGIDATRRVVGLGLRVPRAAANRAGRLIGRGRNGTGGSL
jgi:hypothetical protein